MNVVKLSGSSDDIINIEGDIRDEFECLDDSAVMFSDGTVARIDYMRSGIWKIEVVQRGTAQIEEFKATDPNSGQYSDVLTLRGDIQWVIVGRMAKANRPFRCLGMDSLDRMIRKGEDMETAKSEWRKRYSHEWPVYVVANGEPKSL